MISNNNILDQTKFKAFADDNLYVAKMLISVNDRADNIVGKEKMLVTSIISFSCNVFERLLYQGR